jgi:uncharacterized membrane protein
LWIPLALLSALLWAGSSLVDKLAVDRGYRTLELLPATYTAGFLVVAFRHQGVAELWRWRYLLSGMLLAFFSLLNSFALLMALRCGEVAMVSVVAGSHCVITAVAATLMLGERLSTSQWLAVLLSVAGVCLVFGIRQAWLLAQRRNRQKPSYRWFWLALLAAVGSSGETIGLKMATAICAGGQYSLIWEYFIASLVLHGLVATYRVRLRLRSSLFGLGDGVLTGLGMLTFGAALCEGPASLVATVATAAVLFRALGGIVFFGDRAGRGQWLGFGLLCLAFLLIRW